MLVSCRCRLIRNSNGLTTIQLVKQQEQQSQQELRHHQEMAAAAAAAAAVPMDEEEDDEEGNCSSSSSGHEPEIDVTNVSNSNCDLIRNSSSSESNGAADLRRKYD